VWTPVEIAAVMDRSPCGNDCRNSLTCDVTNDDDDDDDVSFDDGEVRNCLKT